MWALPVRSNQKEADLPWNVREGILNVGGHAAVLSEKYELALELNAELIDVQKSRGANDLVLAETRFNDYGSLLRLKRYNDAERLIWACKEVFERERYQNDRHGLQCLRQY